MHDAAISPEVAIPSAQARAVRASDSTGEPGGARRQRRHLGAGLQVRLAVGAAQVAERLERAAVEDAGQDVVQLAILRPGVVDVVGHDDRQAELVGEGRVLRDEPVVVGQQVVRQLDEEARRGGRIAASPGRPRRPAEQRRVALGGGPRAGAIADQEPPRDLALAAAGQREQALAVLVEQGVGEPGHALGPVEIRAGDEPAQAPIAGRVARQQHEVRPALALADAAQVLLDHRPMAGQARPGRAGPCRQALDRLDPGECRRSPPCRAVAPEPRARPGPGAAESSSSISIPMTGRTPAASAAVVKRTTPYSPSWSVTARPERPSSAARSVMSSTVDAPCRNEKLEWLWSSA